MSDKKSDTVPAAGEGPGRATMIEARYDGRGGVRVSVNGVRQRRPTIEPSELFPPARGGETGKALSELERATRELHAAGARVTTAWVEGGWRARIVTPARVAGGWAVLRETTGHLSELSALVALGDALTRAVGSTVGT